MVAGFARTTTGSKTFGVLKGAVDRLVYPSSTKLFSSDIQKARNSRQKYILGQNIAGHVHYLLEQDNTYKTQFPQYIKSNVTLDMIEEMYKRAHATI